jgi:hypothetical protein
MNSLETLSSEYEALIPAEASKLAQRLSDIDKETMVGALADRFFPRVKLQQLLAETTALHSYFASQFYKWKSILDNQEAESYLTAKSTTLASGEKFVSASAEREASYAVRSLTSLVNFYQGQLARTVEYINSVKKLLDTLVTEQIVA